MRTHEEAAPMRYDHLANAALRAIVPFQSGLRQLKRRVRPYQDNPANSNHCISDGLTQIDALRRAGTPIAGATVLEFGSGWMPLIPLLLHLAGARHVVMTDIARLMDDHTVARAKQMVADRIGDVAACLDVGGDNLLAKLKGAFEPDYLVPWDIAAHPSQSVDIIMSRAVFEHVPEPSLRFFMGHFRRILAPNGAMCHIIDNSDHWEHKDRSLSRIDFVRYEDSDIVWKLAQLNEQAFQNRLRHSDYSAMMTEAGFVIAFAEGQPDLRCLEDLKHLPLASRFDGRDPQDIAILTSLFVARAA